MNEKRQKIEKKSKERSLRAERKRRKKTNREILLVTYVFVGLFLTMIGYLGYFIYAKSDSYVSSSYNANRQDLFTDRYVRGNITSSDGTVLATTVVDGEGNETRSYPFGSVYAHVIGYSTRGKTGVEAVANSSLLSAHINPAITVINELQDKKSQGDTVVTTLNAKVQQAAYEALGDRKGAVVAMDPKTGKILAMVSKPDYNPNKINEIWENLNSEDASLVNRATQGLYPPGSTFKILTALEYIRENPGTYTDFHFDCDSMYEVGEYSIRCSHGVSHGSVGFVSAFADSCNGAYAKIGQTLNFSDFYKLSESFGYNQSLPIALESNASRFTLKTSDSLWDVLQTSIGQGTTQITPLHNAMIAAAVANGGVMMEPYVIDSVQNHEGITITTNSPSTYKTVMTREEADILAEMMRAVVTEGTGSKAEGSSYSAAGKTGSAEFATGKESHAWFIGFADANDPEIVVSVVVEEGGSGGSVAGPIAKKVFDAYYNSK